MNKHPIIISGDYRTAFTVTAVHTDEHGFCFIHVMSGELHIFLDIDLDMMRKLNVK